MNITSDMELNAELEKVCINGNFEYDGVILGELKNNTFNERVRLFEQIYDTVSAKLLATRYTLIYDYDVILGEFYPLSIKTLQSSGTYKIMKQSFCNTNESEKLSNIKSVNAIIEKDDALVNDYILMIVVSLKYIINEYNQGHFKNGYSLLRLIEFLREALKNEELSNSKYSTFKNKVIQKLNNIEFNVEIIHS